MSRRFNYFSCGKIGIYEKMYILNSEKQSIEEMEDGTFCIYDTIKKNLYIINSTSKYILDHLLNNVSVEDIVNRYIADNNIDSQEGSYEQMLADFNEIKENYLKYNIITEI